MKILFLDIDGVVNNHSSVWQFRGFIGIDPYLALLVDRIIQATGCEVVLSSTWRLNEESLEEVKKQVCKIFDITPCIPRRGGSEAMERGHEIDAWLENWRDKVTHYAILDDNNDMLPEQQEHFFKTEWFGPGLTQEIADMVITHLNR